MSTKSKSKTIRIEFHDEHAQAVSIAGTFNDWRPAATPMVNLGTGRWIKDLALPPGRYEYRLVVDGQWICDPAAADTVPNPFGGHNAVLVTPPRHPTRKPPRPAPAAAPPGSPPPPSVDATSP